MTKLSKIKVKYIVDYNNKMGSIDSVVDLSTTKSLGKYLKCFKRFVFHLIDISLYNFYIIYQNDHWKEIKI